MTTRRDIESALMRGADSLRDTLDAANYKDYVLPVMFFKYLCDSYLDEKESLLAEKRRLKKWLLENLLDSNSGVRLPGLKGEWTNVNLLSCPKNNGRYGLNAPACDYEKDLPKYIRITDIDDSGRFSSENEAYVNSPDASNYYLQNGDLLFVRTGA